MADILIRGMEMPQRCKACRFCGFGGRRSELNVCMFTGESQPKLSQERMSKCPLVPVPPHGRLIDADAFKSMCLSATKEARQDFIRHEDWLKSCAVTMSFCSDIDEQPTIVPAEGGTDECSEN